MAVNPKKLRPYDQPPKVRRSFIPNEPDNAATTPTLPMKADVKLL